MDPKTIHIYHIRVYREGEDFSCHYTGTEKDAWQYISPYIVLGYTVEVYLEV
jgi:hypothetical protein